MFKVYSDFAHVGSQTPQEHPGQPVHSEPGFDIWPGTSAGHVCLIQTDGQKLDFPSIAAAVIAARDLINAAPATTAKTV